MQCHSTCLVVQFQNQIKRERRKQRVKEGRAEGRIERKKEVRLPKHFMGGIWLLQLTSYLKVSCKGQLCLDVTIVMAFSSLMTLISLT